MLTLCSASIDWSATGTWITGSATAFIAFLALRTWKSQLQLQDRYQKVDDLLEAFVLTIIAGYDWQSNLVDGLESKKPSVISETEGFADWREALMQYRLAWYKAMHVTGNDVWFSPDKLQNTVIAIGIDKRFDSNFTPETLQIFETKFTHILNQGLVDIGKLRN